MKKNAYRFLVCLTLVLLIGCGSGRTMVLKLPESQVETGEVELVRGESTVEVPEKVIVQFEEELRKVLFEKTEDREAPFVEGPGVKLEYRFIQFDKGNQFSRYMWGGLGNSGEGTLTVQVSYFDNTDQELTTIQSEGKIGSGFFGGSINSAVNRCAEEIANYTETNFR